MPKLFWVHLGNKIMDLFMAITVGFLLAMTAFVGPLQKENAELRAELADPHHCVSYVAENIEQICGDCYAE